MMYRLLEKIHAKILFWLGFGNPDIETNGEKRALSYVASRCGEGPVVFDVGANRGEYTRRVLEAMPSARVYLFEPQKKLYDILAQNFKNSFNVGLSDKRGSVPIFGSLDKDGLTSLYKRNLEHRGVSFEEQEKVELTTLDDFCSEHSISKIQFLKLDIEGHELKALQGAERMLANIDFIQFEFGGCDIDSRTFFQDFWRLLAEQFTIYRITNQGLRPIRRYTERDEVFMTSNYLAERKTQ